MQAAGHVPPLRTHGTMSRYQDNKALVRAYFDELERAPVDSIQDVLSRYHSSDYSFVGVHPFNELSSTASVAEMVWKPLHRALSHLQRRQDIFMAGTSEINGDDWVMSMGHFMGLFDHDWLGIRRTRKLAMLRYAEFNRVEQGKITSTCLWVDIIGLPV